MSKNFLRINIEILSEDGEVLSSNTVDDYQFSKPITASDIGLPLKSQQSLMASIQQNVLDGQAVFLK